MDVCNISRGLQEQFQGKQFDLFHKTLQFYTLLLLHTLIKVAEISEERMIFSKATFIYPSYNFPTTSTTVGTEGM